MNIKQFEYKPLAHYSYAIISNSEMVVIDPERNPIQYYAFAKEHNAVIKAVIETHPHADFISSHLQIHEETGATIYNSEKIGADYPHQSFDDGDSIKIGNITLEAINTPGHSPDSITIVATEGNDIVLFTGDTLFVGDVGRPDLREKSGKTTAKRKELAEMMYDSIQNKFSHLPDYAIVYPAHGAGSLCGKGMSDADSSTLGKERKDNWAFQEQEKDEFISELLDDQPFIPSYFGYDVDVNKSGANNLRASTASVPFKMNSKVDGIIVDVRQEEDFKIAHLEGSFNIQAVSENSKFETWLGATVKPEERFTLAIDNPDNLEKLLNRVAKIGYETQIERVITLSKENISSMDKLDVEHFRKNQDKYTIVDIRNQSEINDEKFFENALEHPLNELRETANKISDDKPIVVHCAGGYRSAIGSSIIKSILKNATVYDLSDDVKQFQ